MSIRFRTRRVGRSLVTVIAVLGLSLASTTSASGVHNRDHSVEVLDSDPHVFCWYTPEDHLTPSIYVTARQFHRLNSSAYEKMAWKPFVWDIITGRFYDHYPWVYPSLSENISTAQFLYPKEIREEDLIPRNEILTYVIDDLPRSVYWVGAWFLRGTGPGSSDSAWYTPWIWNHAWAYTHTNEFDTREPIYCDNRHKGQLLGGCGLFQCESTSAQAQVRRLSHRARAIGSHPNPPPGFAGSTETDPLGDPAQDRSARSGSGPSTAPVADSSRCFGKRPTIVGTEGADVLEGTPHRDVILGLGGDDTIFGGGGHPGDYICAGDGADGVLGGLGRDRIAGDGGDDVVLGEFAADILVGGSGIDYIEPGPGNDQADGGGSPLDILSYLSSSSAVRVDFSTGRTVGEGADTFQGFNAVVGSNGDDSLMGSTGQELFVPVGGDDLVNGGSDADTILYVLSGEGVSVNLAGGWGLGEGSDTLAGLEVVFGSAFDDVIVGDAGYNWLSGEEGNDQLDGLAGDDTLDAGGGVDVCVHGFIYLECENQGGTVFPTPPGDTEAPTDEPPSGP